MQRHLSTLKNNFKNLRKLPHATSSFFIKIQLIYVNSFDMHIGHINTQSKHVT
jgi:hypothetical protein